MSLLRVLLAKDLRRAWRNPLPWLINLALPLCIAGLIGLAFGGSSKDNALGRIRFAVVDEDDSVLTGLLRGAASQKAGGKYLEPVFLAREEALRLVNNAEISAVLIIPTNFTRHYLLGSEPVTLELIKNPAESIHPAVLEEMLGAVTTGLNAVARNFQSEFPAWRAAFDGGLDYREIGRLIERGGDKLKAVKGYVNPPLVGYTKEPPPQEGPREAPAESSSHATKSGGAASIFAFLLPGLAGMFLLFIAHNGMTDLHREVRLRTFARYHTVQERLLPLVTGKVIFTLTMLLASSGIMLGGGGLIFRIHWQHPLGVVLLTVSYAVCAAGIMAMLAGIITDEKSANVLNNLVSMALGLVGGCAFPPQQLPAFLREHITPLLPSYWFANGVRSLEFGGGAPWPLTVLQLAGTGVVLVLVAVGLFRRRFRSGLRE